MRSVPSGTAIFLDAHRLAVEHLALLLDAQQGGQVGFLGWSNHVLVKHEPLAPSQRDLVQLLSEIVIMQPPEGVTVALALDWYQVPPQDDDDSWSYTPAGQLLHDVKYSDAYPPEKGACEAEMAKRLADVMKRHPLYSTSSAVLSTPSSILRNRGLSQRLAEAISDLTGVPFVKTQGRTAVRPSRKSGSDFDLTDEFVVEPAHVRDRVVIIIDDMYREGATMRGVALAARRAGARLVLGLAVARTMRN
jgi:hypothetical protein